MAPLLRGGSSRGWLPLRPQWWKPEKLRMRTMGARRPPIAVAAVDAAWADPCRRLRASSGLWLRRQVRLGAAGRCLRRGGGWDAWVPMERIAGRPGGGVLRGRILRR